MPWPAALLWGAAAIAAAAGVKKGVDAYNDNDRAKSIGEEAERKYKRAEKNLDTARKETQDALEELGRLKVGVFSNQIKHIVDMHKKYRSKLTGFDERISIENLPEVEVFVEKSLEVSSGIASGAMTGALATLGAYGAVGTLATASTGTAIAGLSGVAATNATLAWLGGGSLAAGGFGMAGGMVALGGIALAPLLAVGGFWAASKAEEALTKAEQYAAEVDKACEQMKSVKTAMKGIRSAAAEQAGVIMEAVKRFEMVKVDNMDNREAFTKMMLIGKCLKEILNVPVMDQDGNANKHIRSQCEGYLALA